MALSALHKSALTASTTTVEQHGYSKDCQRESGHNWDMLNTPGRVIGFCFAAICRSVPPGVVAGQSMEDDFSAIA
jgi:hypothetical protein